MTGGDSGPAIDPGNVEGSLLISAIRYESSEMPPDGKLPEQVIQDFETLDRRRRRRSKTSVNRQMPVHDEIDLDAGRKFWAFQPLMFARTPPSRPGSRGTIDQFLDDRLQQANIAANALAEPAVRLRRLAFDLTGLPPDSALQDKWLADPAPTELAADRRFDARLARVRRALGAALDGRCPLRRQQRKRLQCHASRGLALPRLLDSFFRRRPIVGSDDSATDCRRLCCRRKRTPNDMTTWSPARS